MRALLAGLLLAALLAPGCLSPSATLAPRRVEACLGQGFHAEWVQPGLGEAFAEAAARAGVAVERRAPLAGLDVSEPLPGGASLWVARWRPDPARTHPGLLLVKYPDEATHLVQLSGAGSMARDRELLRTFLGHVGLADHPDLPRWEETFLESGDQPGSTDGPNGWREVRVAARPEVGPVVRAALAREDSRVVPMTLGEASLEAGAWELRVKPEVHAASLGEGEDAVRLEVDAFDQVRAQTVVRAPSLAWPALQARVNASFLALGLPPPSFEGAHGGPAAC